MVMKRLYPTLSGVGIGDPTPTTWRAVDRQTRYYGENASGRLRPLHPEYTSLGRSGMQKAVACSCGLPACDTRNHHLIQCLLQRSSVVPSTAFSPKSREYWLNWFDLYTNKIETFSIIKCLPDRKPPLGSFASHFDAPNRSLFCRPMIRHKEDKRKKDPIVNRKNKEADGRFRLQDAACHVVGLCVTFTYILYRWFWSKWDRMDGGGAEAVFSSESRLAIKTRQIEYALTFWAWKCLYL